MRGHLPASAASLVAPTRRGAASPVLIRCSRCGRDAPGDSTACPYCQDMPAPRHRWLRNPILYGAIAAAIEMGILLAILRC
jgi:hypothetical protein